MLMNKSCTDTSGKLGITLNIHIEHRLFYRRKDGGMVMSYGFNVFLYLEENVMVLYTGAHHHKKKAVVL
jgi:hypothetical protein